jgi:hypothetical protein
MIKAKELRLHNKVYYNNIVSTVTKVEAEWIGLDISEPAGNKGSIPASVLDGIPLSPEILEKCGFDKLEEGVFECSKIRIRFFISAGVKVYSFAHDEFISNAPFVHQLQNLYFALTGEELTVQL